MRLRKGDRYRTYVTDLDHQRIEYKPMIWYCGGREHTDTTAILRHLARTAARRRGNDPKLVLSKT